MITSLISILQRLLPNYCLLCKDPTQSHLAMCNYCIERLPWADQLRCAFCAIPLPIAGICGRCQYNPPAFSQVIAPFIYEPPIDLFIARLKFGQKLIYAHLLGHLLAKHLQQIAQPLPQAIIPVPLHNRRLRERGFNQASVIARLIARQLQLPCIHFALKRHKYTAAQAKLNSKARLRNVKSAFKVVKPIPYTSIALVDDVITTSATARQVCLTLTQSGVKNIQVWALARAKK